MLGLVVGLLFILFLVTPTAISSSDSIRYLFLEVIGSFTDTNISIKQLDLQWWKGIRAENIEVLDRHTKKPLFLCEKLETNKKLISWIYNPYDLQELMLIHPQIFIRETEAVGQKDENATKKKESNKKPQKKLKNQKYSKKSFQETVVLPNASISIVQGTIDVETNLQELVLRDCNLQLHTSPEQISCTLDGNLFEREVNNRTEAEELSSHLFADWKVQNPLNYAQIAADWNIDIQNFPIDFLLTTASPLLPQDSKPLLAELLGKRLQLRSQGTSSTKEVSTTLVMQTETISSNVKASGKKDQGRFTGKIDGSNLLSLSITSGGWQALSESFPVLKPFELTQDGKITLAIDTTDFSIPIQQPLEQAHQNVVIPITYTLTTQTPFIWHHQGAQYPLQSHLKINLSRSSGEDAQITTNGQFQLLSGPKRAFIEIAGQPPTVFFPLLFLPSTSKQDLFDLQVKAYGDWDYFIEYLPRTVYNYPLDERILAKIGKEPQLLIHLQGSSDKEMIYQADLVVKSGKELAKEPLIDLRTTFTESPEKTNINLVATLPQFGTVRLQELIYNKKTEVLSGKLLTDNLKNPAFASFTTLTQFTANIPDKSVTATLEASLKEKKILQGALNCSFEEGFSEAKKGNFECDLNLAVDGIQATQFISEPYNHLLGSEVSSALSITFRGIDSSHNNIKFELNGSSLSIFSNFSFQKIEELFVARGATQKALEVKGVLHKAILEKIFPTIKFSSPVDFTITCKKLNLPIFASSPFKTLDSAEIDLEIGIGEIVFGKTSKEPYQVPPHLFTIEIQPGTKSAEISLKGSNTCRIFAKNLWNSEKLTLDSAVINFDADITNLPFYHKKLQALLGDRFFLRANGTITPGLNGKCQLMAGAEHAKASGNFLFKSGVLELESPFIFNFMAPKEAGNEVLSYINPVLETSLYSNSSIHFQVAHEGFRVPLFPFSIATCQVKKATLDIGKLRVANQGVLLDILKLLKDKQAKLQEIDLWATPCYFSIENGSLTCARSDFLLGKSVHISTWGSVDLLNQRPNLVVAIDGLSLTKAFKLKGLPQGYMLQLPISGTLEKPSLDVVKATTKIAALLAAKGIETTTLNTKAGGLLGSLFIAATQAIDLDPPPPSSNNISISLG